MLQGVLSCRLLRLLFAAALALPDRLVVQLYLEEKFLVVVRPALGYHVVGQHLPAPALDYLL